MLGNASAIEEASFLDGYASPASRWPDDYCLPQVGIRPIGQCFVDGGAVDEPCDWAMTADGFPATLFSCTAALLWREGRVTDSRWLDIYCASTTSSSAPMANQLKVGASNALFSGHGRTTGIMTSHIFLFIPQLFGALALGPDCHGVPRHAGMLGNALAIEEASFLDGYASPASPWPGDYCLPQVGIRPIGQCFVDGGAVDEPCDWAMTADGFPATLFSCTAALLWREGRVTDSRWLDIYCASTTSSSAPMANQLKVGASNALFSGHGRTTGIMTSHIFLFIPQNPQQIWLRAAFQTRALRQPPEMKFRIPRNEREEKAYAYAPRHVRG
ncbi:hypothetical protein MTO96_028270 [Rhipicephalus appendiculatus]